MFEKIKYYFLETLWNFSLNEKQGKDRFFLKWFRVAFLSVKGFIENQCGLRASSLTYYTIMSIVPILALGFAIAGSFGLYENFRVQILTQFPEQREVFTELFKFADTLLAQTRGGVIASFGLIVIVLVALFMLSSIEEILNDIWGVKKLRSWWRILTDYIALLIFAPLLFILANSVSVFLVEQSIFIVRSLPLPQMAIGWIVFAIKLIRYCLFWIVFTFIYFFMPNTRVHFRSALIAGIFAGTFYVIIQLSYFYFQFGVARYGAIYGSIAAIPLFLIWLQISWSIFLLGAELSHAHQTHDLHEYKNIVEKLSHRYKRLVSLWLIHLAIQKGFLCGESLAKEHRIPKALSEPILNELVECKILRQVEKGYAPVDLSIEMRISDCLEALDQQGINRVSFIESSEFIAFEKALREFKKAIECSPQNMRLKDVSDSI